jgi:PAS domain S-box-containing protein
VTGWELVSAFNFITAASYLGIACFVVRGLISTHQLMSNRLAVATAAIFVACAAHHLLHALDFFADGDAMQVSMMRELMGQSIDVVVTALTAVTGVLYLALRRSYGMLLRSPALFDHAAEIRYRQLAANLPHTAVFVYDADLRYLLAGGTAMTEVGYERSAMEGRYVADVVPPAVWARIEQYYRRALAGETVSFDHTSSVTGVVFHNRIGPLLDESGRIIGGLVVSEDVTEDRRIRSELHEAQAFNAAVLAASPDVTVISSMQTGQMTWASRSVLELLGWPPGDTSADEGSLLKDLVAQDDQDALARVNRSVADLPDGDSVTFRLRVRSPDGQRWLARQSTPFHRDAAGTVMSYLSIVRDVTDIVQVERRMEHAALHDPLTGLPNRALLLDRMTSALARADRLGAEVAVLFCDLDGFKKVNDQHGHAAGDSVLTRVADRLENLIRKSDTVARVGGDEFVVILDPSPVRSSTPGQPADGPDGVAHHLFLRQVASTVADRIRAELSRPIDIDGQRHAISVSVGMTFAAPRSSAQDVLRDADSALYRAKQRGKNRVEVFDETLGADVVERNRVERVLRQALDPERTGPSALTVAYQPVYDLADNALVGFEALARLRDDAGLPIRPDAFIPIAEETGLITPLGEQVLNEALACLVGWRADHPDARPATMAVNLSARQAQHANMPTVVHSALARHHLRASDLILELTESVLLESGSSTLRQLTELRESGVGIAIDDFGTGYASLRYLATLPVSSVKVDRSFTATLTSDRTSATIVHAIATLARDLGLDCVVEGLETQQQIEALPVAVLGQGYLLGRPTPLPQDTWLTAAH